MTAATKKPLPKKRDTWRKLGMSFASVASWSKDGHLLVLYDRDANRLLRRARALRTIERRSK